MNYKIKFESGDTLAVMTLPNRVKPYLGIEKGNEFIAIAAFSNYAQAEQFIEFMRNQIEK